eukprot:8969476-Alexandrium_andersonii.AAC.1
MNVALGGVVLWGCETRRPTLEDLRQLIRFERKLARLVCPLVRKPNEHVWQWQQRHSRHLESIYEQMGLFYWGRQWVK